MWKKRGEKGKWKMSKIEIISEIINVYDENESLKRKVEMLESRKEVSVNIGEKLSITDSKLLVYGKQKLVEDLLYDWSKSVNIAKNEDTGELKIESYKDWFRRAFGSNNVPTNMSKEEAINVVEPEFMKIYEEQKRIAIEKFKQEEEK